jgi:hypothetical protein
MDNKPSGLSDYGAAIEAEVMYRRARARFALRRIYDMRNQIVHEALPTRLDLYLYADDLEQMVADVLRKIVDRFLNPDAPPTSVADVQRFVDALGCSTRCRFRIRLDGDLRSMPARRSIFDGAAAVGIRVDI